MRFVDYCFGQNIETQKYAYIFHFSDVLRLFQKYLEHFVLPEGMKERSVPVYMNKLCDWLIMKIRQ